jgi:hypothetical protein
MRFEWPCLFGLHSCVVRHMNGFTLQRDRSIVSFDDGIRSRLQLADVQAEPGAFASLRLRTGDATVYASQFLLGPRMIELLAPIAGKTSPLSARLARVGEGPLAWPCQPGTP